MKEEIKEILDDLRNKDCYINNETTLTFDEAKDILDYITNLQERFNALLEAHKIADELETEYQERNEKTIENIDLVIEIIKQQPTEDDTWILNKLNGFKFILKGDKDE